MTEQEKGQIAGQDSPKKNSIAETEEGGQKPLTAVDFRKASYFILTVGAIFVINAMETGSYRTPWPVAVVVSLAGFGLLAYSLVKAKRERTET